jgi:hypothetical protein
MAQRLNTLLWGVPLLMRKGGSTVLIIAVGRWEKSVPRGYLLMHMQHISGERATRQEHSNRVLYK